MTGAHRWVMIDGVGPGIGKSTLAENLGAALSDRDLASDVVAPEDVIFTRPEFADASRGFRSKDYDLARDGLLSAYRALADVHAEDGATIIFDWSAASMAEDLPWAAELGVLVQHMREVTEIVASYEPVLFMLEGPMQIARDRALAQRGREWMRNYEASASFGTEHHRVERVTSATNAVGWPIVSLNATVSADEVLAAALRSLEVA